MKWLGFFKTFSTFSVISAVSVIILGASISVEADQIEYTFYHFKDNHSNTVATTAFSLAKTIWSRTLILMDVELDQVTQPPTDAVSSASRPQRQSKSEIKKNRGQIIGGVEQGLGDNTKINGSYYFSQEVDYSSQSFIAGITQDIFQKNLTVSFKGQYTMDSVGEILNNGDILNRFKETHQASLIISQIFTPTTIFRCGADAMRNQGFLSDPYRKVVLTSANVANVIDTISERHPSLRFRQSAWAEVSQYLDGMDASFVLTYRYYWDDWGMNSHTGSLKFNKYITPDWILSPEYRYYIQNGATFGSYGTNNPGAYDVTDYKLKPFASNNAGMGLTCYLRAFGKNHPTWDFLTNTSISLLYFHYFNDAEGSNFSANIYESRLKFSF